MIKVNVEIDNKSWNKKIKNPKKYFLKKLKKISAKIHFFKKKNITFTILLTNSFNMKKLNKKFRKVNKATDVLSFPSFTLKNLKLETSNKFIIKAFQRRFRQKLINGISDLECFEISKNLIKH